MRKKTAVRSALHMKGRAPRVLVLLRDLLLVHFPRAKRRTVCARVHKIKRYTQIERYARSLKARFFAIVCAMTQYNYYRQRREI